MPTFSFRVMIQSHSIARNEHKFLEVTHMFGYLACISLLQRPSQCATQPEWLKQQNVSSHSAAGENSKNQRQQVSPPEGLERRTCFSLLLLTCRFSLLLMSSYVCIFPLSLSVSMFKFPLLIKTPVILD